MARSGYLWGTRGTEYCELGRSAGLEDQLRRLGAVSPELALEETMKMLSGCSLSSEARAAAGNGLTIRYCPVHLYKRQQILADMESFAAFCTSGPETGSGRESGYSHLTVLDREDLFSSFNKEQTWLDRIFGTPLMTAEAQQKIREGAQNVNLAPEPAKVSAEIGEEEKTLLSLIVTALYQSVNSRVILRMPETKQFEKDSLSLLAKAWSLLPAKMAEETGFSVGEDPSEITERIGKANIRVFVLRAETVPDPARDFPENAVFLDLAAGKELPVNYDTELDGLIRRWAGFSREQRRSAMELFLADEEQYFLRDFYIRGSREFLEHPFWAWKEQKDRRFDPKGAKGFEARYLEVKELYQLYAKFDICRRLPWVREEFIKSIPDFLAEGDSLALLRQAVVLKALDAGPENPNTVENCRGYRKWLTGLMNADETKDDSFECAALAAEAALKKAENTRKEELDAALAQKDAALQEKDGKLAEKDRLLQEKDRAYTELAAELADKEAQWGAFVDSLEQQLGQQTVEQTATDAARKRNPEDARKVDALLLDLAEAGEANEALQEDLRHAKEQLEYEKLAASRRRAKADRALQTLKLALLAVIAVCLLLGILLVIKLR